MRSEDLDRKGTIGTTFRPAVTDYDGPPAPSTAPGKVARSASLSGPGLGLSSGLISRTADGAAAPSPAPAPAPSAASGGKQGGSGALQKARAMAAAEAPPDVAPAPTGAGGKKTTKATKNADKKGEGAKHDVAEKDKDKDKEHDHEKSATSSSGHDEKPASHTPPSAAPPPSPTTHASHAPPVARAADDAGIHPDAADALATAARSSGAPLPANLQRKFADSLGADLSQVRVHTGADSAAASQAVAAKAYTVGQDIHFGAGHFAPTSNDGERLLAHEVSHTVQQAGGASRSPMCKLEISSPGDAHEIEADRAADAMVRGEATTVSGGGGVARKVDRDPEAAPAAPKPAEKKHKLSAADKNHIQNASNLIQGAIAGFNTGKGAFQGYAGAAPGKIQSFKSTSKATIKTYQDAQRRVNSSINAAKEMAAFQDAMLSAVIGAAFNGFGVAKEVEDIAEEEATTFETVKKAVESLHDFAEAAEPILGPLGEAAMEDMGGGEGGGEGGGGNPDLQQLAFYQQLADLESQSTKLLPLGVGLASAGMPLGQLTEKLSTIVETGEMKGSAADVDAAAAYAQDGANQLAAMGEAVPAMMANLDAAVASATAAKPKSDADAERQLWLKWLANPANAGTSDENIIEERLTKMGVFQKLGIDFGSRYSGDEQVLASATADAVSRAESMRGTEVQYDGASNYIGLGAENMHNMHCHGVGFDSDHPSGKARVTGASIIGKMDTDDMKGGWAREDFVRHILESGWVDLELTRLEDE